MKKIKRVFLIVLDSLGIGYAPDAELFGDVGADTLRRISRSKEFSVNNLLSLGLGGVDGLEYLPKNDKPSAATARLRELSLGKDTTVGHWELAGIISEKPFPTYPDGFPEDIISKFCRTTGKGVICNRPYSGTEVIKDFGKRHMESGDLIVYTSADSVFQIAAHEDIVPVKKLYEYCEIARDILVGEHAVGRVIARPFIGEVGNFTRTENRRDFSLKPPRDTALDAICKAGLEVIAIGKITDIFAGQGITESFHTHSNLEGMRKTEELLRRDFSGLCFTNLVDFDMLYGHRQDIDGYALALSEFDAWLDDFINKMKKDDVLMITADHGCDPGDNSTDHTREYVPLLIYGEKIKPCRFGTIAGFTPVGALAARLLGVEYDGDGNDKILLEVN